MGGSLLSRIGWSGASNEDENEFSESYDEWENAAEEGAEVDTVPYLPHRSTGGATLTAISSHTSSQREGISRILTVHPRSFSDATKIGDPFREGIPVIVNLSELDGPEVRRVVDFISGMTFALRGKAESITSRVILLSPASIQVETQAVDSPRNPF